MSHMPLNMLAGLCSGFYLACEQALWALWQQGGKRKESLQLRLWNLNICIEKVDAKCWFVEMTSAMTSLCLLHDFQCLLTFLPISTLRWLVEIWQLSRWRATGGFEVKLNSRDIVTSSPSFPTPPQEHPGELACMLAFIDGRPHATKFKW